MIIKGSIHQENITHSSKIRHRTYDRSTQDAAPGCLLGLHSSNSVFCNPLESEILLQQIWLQIQGTLLPPQTSRHQVCAPQTHGTGWLKNLERSLTATQTFVSVKEKPIMCLFCRSLRAHKTGEKQTSGLRWWIFHMDFSFSFQIQ